MKKLTERDLNYVIDNGIIEEVKKDGENISM